MTHNDNRGRHSSRRPGRRGPQTQSSRGQPAGSHRRPLHRNLPFISLVLALALEPPALVQGLASAHDLARQTNWGFALVWLVIGVAVLYVLICLWLAAAYLRLAATKIRLLLLIMLPLASLVIALVWFPLQPRFSSSPRSPRIQRACPSKQVCIVVARLGGVDGGVGSTLVTHLQSEVHPFSELGVVLAKQTIDSTSSALQLGKRLGAAVVVWGEANRQVAGGVLGHVDVELLDPPTQPMKTPNSFTLDLESDQVNHFNEVIRNTGTSLSYIALVCTALLHLERLDAKGALNELDDAINMALHGMGRERARQAGFFPTTAYYYAGIVEMNDYGDYKAAEHDFGGALVHPRIFPSAYVMRASARIALKNYRGALDDLYQAGRLAKPDAFTWEVRADAAIGLRDYRGALSDSEHAIDAGSVNWGNNLRRATAYAALRMNSQAAREFDHAGSLALASGAPLEAYNSVLQDKIDALYPEDGSRLATALSGESKPRVLDASALARATVKALTSDIRGLQPGDVTAQALVRFYRGKAYLTLHDEKALYDFSSAIKLLPGDPQFYYYRAEVEGSMGLRSEATTDWATFSRLAPYCNPSGASPVVTVTAKRSTTLDSVVIMDHGVVSDICWTPSIDR